MGRAPASGTAKLSPRKEDTGPKPVLEEQGGPAGRSAGLCVPLRLLSDFGEGSGDLVTSTRQTAAGM